MHYVGAILLWIVAAVLLLGALGGVLEMSRGPRSVGDVILAVVLAILTILFVWLGLLAWRA